MIATDLAFYLDIAQKAVTFGIAVWLYLEKKRDTTHARIDALERSHDERLDDHARRIATVEARSGPTHADLGDMHEKINQVANTSSRMEGEIKGLGDTVRLILSRITERGMK
ncbi:hypothetical protein dqs_0612 [Azoarcus olearius]|uniref:hypothetical protein n=1 Tax=Azoarcus sp. (strain BH72) TaxID=418699 RepID=UPI0008063157|nr:hypothetical protein [Azoarcus olearius]ANQ83688.1 hypothetical protein dqs_0612 [Azoarcus olearius]